MVAELCLLQVCYRLGMASPTRLEEGFRDLVGSVGTGLGAGQGVQVGQGNVPQDPWQQQQAGINRHIPSTPDSSSTSRPSRTAAQPDDAWARYQPTGNAAVGQAQGLRNVPGPFATVGNVQQQQQSQQQSQQTQVPVFSGCCVGPGHVVYPFQQQQQQHAQLQQGFGCGPQGQGFGGSGTAPCFNTHTRACAPVQQSQVNEMTELRQMIYQLQQNMLGLMSAVNVPESNVSNFGQQYGLESGRAPRPPFSQSAGDVNWNAGLDVLSKTEKWLPGLPKALVETWKDREAEITGFLDFVTELRAWASLVSPKFAAEIHNATQCQGEILMASLTREQQARASRLVAILQSSFKGHGRAEAIIRAFTEGVAPTGSYTAAVYGENGFELLRVLTLEFTLQSRAEALALRAELMQRSFAPGKTETSQGTLIADTVRKLETSLSRYNKLVSTLPAHIVRVGIEVSEADKLVLLLRSLPKEAAEFILLHSAQDTYEAARATAHRYESQRRLYLEWGSFGGKVNKLLHGVGPEQFDMAAGDEAEHEACGVNAVGDRCSKCGSKRHATNACSVDLSRTKCFKCGQTGHVSMNCKSTNAALKQGQHATGGNKGSGSSGGSKGKGSQKGKGKGKNAGKGKGKGKGKGAKGKMFEVAEEAAGACDAEDWWYEDEAGGFWTWSESWGEPEGEASPNVCDQGNTASVTPQPASALLIASVSGILLDSVGRVGDFSHTNSQRAAAELSEISCQDVFSSGCDLSNLWMAPAFPICFQMYLPVSFSKWSETKTCFCNETETCFCNETETCFCSEAEACLCDGMETSSGEMSLFWMPEGLEWTRTLVMTCDEWWERRQVIRFLEGSVFQWPVELGVSPGYGATEKPVGTSDVKTTVSEPRHVLVEDQMQSIPSDKLDRQTGDVFSHVNVLAMDSTEMQLSTLGSVTESCDEPGTQLDGTPFSPDLLRTQIETAFPGIKTCQTDVDWTGQMDTCRVLSACVLLCRLVSWLISWGSVGSESRSGTAVRCAWNTSQIKMCVLVFLAFILTRAMAGTSTGFESACDDVRTFSRSVPSFSTKDVWMVPCQTFLNTKQTCADVFGTDSCGFGLNMSVFHPGDQVHSQVMDTRGRTGLLFDHGFFEGSDFFHEHVVSEPGKTVHGPGRTTHEPGETTHEFEEPVQPILYELASQPGGFWLLDSGAAATVVSQETYNHFKKRGAAGELVNCSQSFYAANGSSVSVAGSSELTGFVMTKSWKSGIMKPQHLKITAVVGGTKHDIISTNQCCSKGWSFKFDGLSGSSMHHVSSETQVMDVVQWGGCPWIPFVATLEELNQLSFSQVTKMEMRQSLQEAVQYMSPITATASSSELLEHRLRGHTPFHPACGHCLKSRSVKQHRRLDKDNRLQVMIAADFFYLETFKGLAITELSSGALGAIPMTENVQADRNLFLKWMTEFGLTSSNGISVQLISDAESAVSAFVTGATESSSLQWMIERAPPQGHEFVGNAERAIRTIKERISTIRSELAEAGLGLNLSSESFADILKYVCHSNNLFNKPQGGERTCKELITGSKMKEPTFAMFLSKCLAELPDSVKQKYPAAPRFVNAVYLSPVWSSVGCEVIGEISSNTETRFVRFHARSIKHVLPVAWDEKFYADLIALQLHRHQHGGDGQVSQEPQVMPNSEPSRKCPSSGPPAQWIRNEGGFTDGCIACKGLKEKNSRKGLVLSKACCKRYEEFLKAPGKEVVSSEGGPNLGQPARTAEALPPSLEDLELSGNGSKDVEESKSQQGSNEYEPSFLPEDETDRLEDFDTDEELEKRRDKRFDTGFETDEEPPLKRRMVGKQTDHAGAFEPPSSPRRVGLKRASEMDLKELEKELRDQEKEEDAQLSVHWVQPFLNFASVVTEPPSREEVTMGNELVGSVRFGSGIPETATVHLGGMDIKVWCPTDAVDDTTGEILDGKKCHQGMQKEIEGLQECHAGDCYSISDFQKLQKTSEHPIRLISTRWVTTAKGDEVRSRMVVKDVKSKDSARSLGISSPTLGSDAFQLFLSFVSVFGSYLYTLDISHAFMFTPLRKRDVAVKLPLSCSTLSGEPVILHCATALNGLRSASLEWLLYLQSQLKGIGLFADAAEPCLLSGRLPSGNRAILIVYVDDIAVSVETESDFRVILQCLQRKLKVKHTGTIDKTGGKVTFLGRQIVRTPGDNSLFVYVPSEYMDKTLLEWNLKSGASARAVCPNILSMLDDGKDSEPLSSEAHNKFRSALGKIAWLAQTRQDLKHYVALLGTVQASPNQAAEKALRALLRFLAADTNIGLRIPAEDSTFGSKDPLVVTSYSDASHAPSTRNRRGVTGGVISYAGALIKAFSRHQTSVSLSSCEAELQALQSNLQEAIVLARLVARILRTMNDISDRKNVVCRIFSDSESALKLLKAVDLPRRSRHITVKIEWMRELIAQGLAEMVYLKGTELPADSLTKCLNTEKFLVLRSKMGFTEIPLVEAVLSVMRPRKTGFALLEVCCSVDSALRQSCLEGGIPYRGISYGVEMQSVLKQAKEWASGLNVCLHVHLSTLCSSGSPLRRFVTDEQISELDASWDEHIKGAVSFMTLGNSTSFELPLVNAIWNRWFVKRTLNKFGHVHEAVVHLCQTGLKGTDNHFIGKRLRFTTDVEELARTLHEAFGTCRCKDGHANFNYVTWRNTALYNKRLADVFIKGLRNMYE